MVDLRRILQRLVRRKISKDNPPARLPGESPPPLVRIPQTHQEAAQRLVDRQRVESLGFRRASIRVNRQGLEPDIERFLVAFLKDLNRRGFPFVLVSAVRTHEEQMALFQKGVSKAKPGQSPHNHGMAVDIVHQSRGWDLTAKEWAIIGLIGKEVARRQNLKITWGGDWKFYDPAHWELADWRKRVLKAE